MSGPYPSDPDTVRRKTHLRSLMRQVVDDVADRDVRSVELWWRLAQVDRYAEARTVMAYASMPNEPDTEALFRRLGDTGKRLVLPRVVGDDIVPVAAGEQWTTGTWGIAEPVGPAVPAREIDLVVVPGLAFTVDGARLGRGKGFYDRFLRSVDAYTVGVCFAEQLLDELPTDPHDVGLDTVLWC